MAGKLFKYLEKPAFIPALKTLKDNEMEKLEWQLRSLSYLTGELDEEEMAEYLLHVSIIKSIYQSAYSRFGMSLVTKPTYSKYHGTGQYNKLK